LDNFGEGAFRFSTGEAARIKPDNLETLLATDAGIPGHGEL
jgi:hypothetical protein